MSSRHVLLVALDPVSKEQIRSAIETRQEVDDVSVHVVAPAATLGPVKWVMGDEDEARAEAGELADRAADAVGAEVPVEEVETEVGDRDPLVAVEDALAVFPADEIVLAGHADEKTEARIRSFGLPVERLDGADEVGGAAELARSVARGRSTRTPILVFAGVGAVILGAIALLSLLAFLVSWLV
jgi:hypothetical protein